MSTVDENYEKMITGLKSKSEKRLRFYMGYMNGIPLHRIAASGMKEAQERYDKIYSAYVMRGIKDGKPVYSLMIPKINVEEIRETGSISIVK